MKYPIILHRDPGKSGFGAIVFDFPGCFTAADSMEELQANVQEVAELYFMGEPEDLPVPAPSPVEAVRASEYAKDGEVVLVDVDLSFLERKE